VRKEIPHPLYPLKPGYCLSAVGLNEYGQVIDIRLSKAYKKLVPTVRRIKFSKYEACRHKSNLSRDDAPNLA
jgi:hypothetical protein